MVKKLISINSFWKDKKVFLTGHTGFKGSWLLLILINLGAEVFGYSLEADQEPNLFRFLYPNIKSKFTHFESDINDFKILSESVSNFNPDIVIHFAAQPLVTVSYEKPRETWQTNLIGTLNLLESLKNIQKKCSILIVTTDKVYENKEWDYGYRENDRLGGKDPYSASKAASEICVESWRSSFCGNKEYQTNFLKIATARAGNVIGGGDWSKNRIVPDVVKSLHLGKKIKIRNPQAKRPWQHVLEPLSGYLKLIERQMLGDNDLYSQPFNFGPNIESNKSVIELVDTILVNWNGEISINNDSNSVHESKLLHLNIDKAYQILDWSPKWKFEKTISKTISWYKDFYDGLDPYEKCIEDINDYF